MKYCKTNLFAALLGVLLLPVVCLASALQVEELEGNALDAYGLEKTLPFTSWGDVPFDELKDMTLSLSTQKQSAALAALTVDVLTQPTFIKDSGWTKAQSEQWLLTRLQALLNIGRADLVLDMIKGLPQTAITKDILKVKADALFLQDDWMAACVIAVQNAGKDVYFNAMQMMCLGLMGEKDKAMLAFDMWQEEYGEENMPSYLMGQLMEIPIKAPEKSGVLTIAEGYVLQQLKMVGEFVLPPAHQRLQLRQFSGFGNAVNADKLFEVWQKSGLTAEQQAYRFYLFVSYADLFLPDLRIVRKGGLWAQPMTKQNLSSRVVFLKDKPETQITGSDLLLGLWLLSEQAVDAGKVFLLLNKGGLNLEPFILEQINP